MRNYKKGDACFESKIQQWANSIDIRIPFRLADKYGIVKGTELYIRDMKNGIELKTKGKPTSDDILTQCDGENLYEKFFGKPMGKEEL